MKKIFMRFLINQRGASLFLFALILPVILGFAALAVDIGNVYVHKSQLQNMTDASVLAAAKVYSEDSSTDVRAIAQSYIDKNLQNNAGYNHPDFKTAGDPYIINDGSSTKLRLTLVDTVPMYLIKVLGINNINISATATAKIIPDSWPFTDLVNFTESMTVENGFKNGTYNTTFDGRIVYNADPLNIDYGNVPAVASLFTYAHGENHPLLDVKPEVTETQLVHGHQTATFDKSNLNIATINTVVEEGINYIYWVSDTAQKLNFHTPVFGDTDSNLVNKPIYIIYKGNAENVEFNFSSSTGRPVVLFYLGTHTLNITSPGNADVNFRGVVYAPNATVISHQNGQQFHGSIYAKNFSAVTYGNFYYDSFDGAIGNTVSLTPD